MPSGGYYRGASSSATVVLWRTKQMKTLRGERKKTTLPPTMPERTQKPPTPAPWEPKSGDSDGPKSPDVSKPDTKDLLKRMKKVDPNQSKRYRQRTGQ